MTAPYGEPPLEALPPDAPATVEDVRSGRRWTWVALAWAVAASAIAVIALIQAHDAKNTQSQTTTQSSQGVSAQQLKSFEDQTNQRLDALNKRLQDTATSADLNTLSKQVTQNSKDISKLQDNQTKQSDAITQNQSDIKTLQQQVSDLQQQQQKQQQQGNNSTGTTTTP